MLLLKMSHSELQNDLNHLISWSEKWQLKFTKFKVEVLLSGQTDTKSYTMLNIDIGQMQELQFIDEGKDLGVIIDSKLKFSSHIVNQLKKANRLMRLIQRSYNLLDMVSFKYLFISVVRLRTKWFWVRVQLQSLHLQISRLLSGNYRVWIHSETRT